MKLILKKEFPEATICSINANGKLQNEQEKGVTVKVWGDDNDKPIAAEVFATNSKDVNNYAEIGLIVENKEVVEYDGVFDMPDVLKKTLEELGYSLSEL